MIFLEDSIRRSSLRALSLNSNPHVGCPTMNTTTLRAVLGRIPHTQIKTLSMFIGTSPSGGEADFAIAPQINVCSDFLEAPGSALQLATIDITLQQWKIDPHAIFSTTLNSMNDIAPAVSRLCNALEGSKLTTIRFAFRSSFSGGSYNGIDVREWLDKRWPHLECIEVIHEKKSADLLMIPAHNAGHLNSIKLKLIEANLSICRSVTKIDCYDNISTLQTLPDTALDKLTRFHFHRPSPDDSTPRSDSTIPAIHLLLQKTPNLTDLSLSLFEMSQQDVRQCILACPKLQQLSLSRFYPFDDVEEWVGFFASVKPLLKHLRVLKLRVRYLEEDKVDADEDEYDWLDGCREWEKQLEGRLSVLFWGCTVVVNLENDH